MPTPNCPALQRAVSARPSKSNVFKIPSQGGDTIQRLVPNENAIFSVANEVDCIELGLSCAEVCRALDRGTNGKKLDDLGKFVCDAISQPTRWVELAIHTSNPSTYHVLGRRAVAEIQKKIIKQSGRRKVSRLLHARSDNRWDRRLEV